MTDSKIFQGREVHKPVLNRDQNMILGGTFFVLALIVIVMMKRL